MEIKLKKKNKNKPSIKAKQIAPKGISGLWEGVVNGLGFIRKIKNK